MAGQGLSRAGFAAIAALVLAASAFISIEPAAAANSERAVYCLSGESENDCGFTSLAQCEATASGGLGECAMVAAGPLQRDPYALYRFQAKSHKVSLLLGQRAEANRALPLDVTDVTGRYAIVRGKCSPLPWRVPTTKHGAHPKSPSACARPSDRVQSCPSSGTVNPEKGRVDVHAKLRRRLMP
jgi:hypothetical protein